MKVLFFAAAALVTLLVIVALRMVPVRPVQASDRPKAPDTGKTPDGTATAIRLFSAEKNGYVMLPPVVKSEAEWKAILAPMDFSVARQAGTERAFTGRYHDEHRAGIYRCVACETDLFRSEAKFESGTGWPSFYEPIAPENVTTKTDRTVFMERVEVLCPRCGSHLGHVFDDGPRPTGKRYCMNSAAMKFVPR